MLKKTMPLFLMFILLSSYADKIGFSHEKWDCKIDQLKPEDFKRRKKLNKILNKCAENGLEYDIKVTKESNHGNPDSTMFPLVFFSVYHIKLPSKIQKEIDYYKKHHGFCRDVFSTYIEDKKYSFYCYIFLLAVGSTIPPEKDVVSVVNKDKKLYDKNLIKKSQEVKGSFSLCKTFYERELFLNKLPEGFLDEIDLKPYSDWFCGSFSSINNCIERNRSPELIRKYKKYISNYNEKGKLDSEIQIENNNSNLKWWLQFCLADDEEKVPENLKAFLAWLRSQQEFKPLYSAIMMSLFIVKGYKFDDKTGDYIPNEPGIMMLDYIVQHPIPENAERLDIIMNGGNKKLITDLMKKYNTTETWSKLFEQSKNK